MGICSKCSADGPVVSFTLSAGTGVEDTDRYCVRCLNADNEIVVDVVQAVIPTGGPPTRKMRKVSDRQERRIAESIGGRTQPGSGNQSGAKGDVRKRGEHRIEAKGVYSSQYILRRQVLDKIRGECDRKEQPALVLDFTDRPTGRVLDSWTIIPTAQWEELVNAAGKDR